MHRNALVALALVACAITSATRADEDLDSLLSELTFDEKTLVNLVTPTVDEATSTPLELLPTPPAVPTLELTENVPMMLDQPVPPSHGSPTSDFVPAFNELDSGVSNPVAPSIPVPVPVPAPSPTPTPLFDAPVQFNQYFSQNGYGDQCASGCDTIDLPCETHRPPTLPPPSSLLQYMRSDNCHSDIWAGYAAEKARRCQKLHDHLHRRCDCFSNGPSQCDACPPAASPANSHSSSGCNCGKHL